MSKQKEILIQGARANNLKNITVAIPYNQFVVVTGVSGSGKSSLTMDTLYAEGQRRYVESLSSYARQFLGRMKKPEVDYIRGICPAIAIEQRVGSGNARSTVGSMTELFDYLRLLFARIGETISPISGNIVKKHEVRDVVDFINTLPEGTAVQLLIPFAKRENMNDQQSLEVLLQKGFTRLFIAGAAARIEDAIADNTPLQECEILIDRFMAKTGDTELSQRMADSIQTAFNESGGDCWVLADGKRTIFNNRFELDGMTFIEPTPYLFNYNNPFGACPTCEGYGKVVGIDEDKVIPDKNKSVFEGAVAAWRGETMGEWQKAFLKAAHKFDFPVHRSYRDLDDAEKDILWQGNSYTKGINAFFEEIESQRHKIQYRVLAARYRGKTNCPTCRGKRLRAEAMYVKVAGKTLPDLAVMPIDKLKLFFEDIAISEHHFNISKRLLIEIKNRLAFMVKVGLAYLHLERGAATLSGGETQRIHLTRILGSNLTGSLYLLDEPSIGLHPRDTGRLVEVLKNLRDLGNTVVVVEHEEDMIKNADYLVDVGPEAGVHGGEIVFAGDYEDIYTDAPHSLTAAYMSGRKKIEIPALRRKFTHSLWLRDVRQHNLKGFDVQIPLNVFTVVTGVSGSGKTTLIKQILYPALQKKVVNAGIEITADFGNFEGDLKVVTQVELVNQNPIGKSSRSNPVTYIKAYDEIRELMASQQLSKIQGYKAKHFSFNVEGGRCEVCKGDGEQVVEMQFLADVHLECEECRGQRFQSTVLEVQYEGKNIYEILELTVDQAITFFRAQPGIVQKMRPLADVGLGYIKLGQASSTLSGGEAQRVKLASFLNKDKGNEHIVFIFDEPTTGLHFHDIAKLLTALQALVEKGHTVIVIEHNLEIVKSADWVIDLGPEGGNEGGNLVFTGTPEDLIHCAASYTGQYLKTKF